MSKENQNVKSSTQKEFVLTRVFNAPKDLVWKVHTESEHMAKWWGPKGFKMLKAKLDLHPGGMFHYGMQSPDGQEMWGRMVYREINPKDRLVFVTSFSDKNGGITRHPLAPNFPAEVLNTMTLSEKDGKTTLTIKGYPINATEEETNFYNSMFEGMNQGFKGTFDQLDEYLGTLTK